MNWLIVLWKMLTDHPDAVWSRLRSQYPGRRIRPILRYRKGKWKIRAFKVDPPSELELQIEAAVRRAVK